MAGSTMRPAAPIRSASRAKLAAAAVVSSLTPAMTGTRPSLASTAPSSTLRFSAALRELPSPTVPISTSPCTPSRTSAACTRRVAAKSTSSAASNCVVAAGDTPDQPHPFKSHPRLLARSEIVYVWALSFDALDLSEKKRNARIASPDLGSGSRPPRLGPPRLEPPPRRLHQQDPERGLAAQGHLLRRMEVARGSIPGR